MWYHSDLALALHRARAADGASRPRGPRARRLTPHPGVAGACGRAPVR